MGSALKHESVAIDDYLAAEAQATVRHEYLDGEVFAMTGGRERHNRITGNIFFHFRAATRLEICAAFGFASPNAAEDRQPRRRSGVISTPGFRMAMWICPESIRDSSEAKAT